MSRDLDELLGAGEGVVLETRQHWFVVVQDIVLRLLVLFALAIGIWYVGDAGWLDNTAGDWIANIGWIAFAVVLGTVAWTVAGWVTERFYVTTHRVIYAHGILNRSVTTTPLVKIDEMTLERPLLGRMLGYGQLVVENASGGTEPLAGLEYLPNPTKLYQMIGERSRHQRMHEGGAHVDRDQDGFIDSERRDAPRSEHSATDDDRWRPGGGSSTGT